MVGEIPCDPDVISSWRFCEAEAEYITHCWSLKGVAWDFEKAKWAKYFLEMLWGLEYSICFIILMISMCFFPSEYHDDFAILTVSEILRSWPLSAHFLLLPVLAGPTIHRRWIHIYIHTYYICWIEVYNLSRSDLGWYPSWWTSSPWILVMPSFLDAVPPGEETSLFSVSVHAVHDANHWGMMKPDPSFRII